MREIHPFGSFVPKDCRYLFLGSFPGVDHEDWFFGAKRNQFWLILREVYKRSLLAKEEKQELFEDLGLGITDVIKSCERRLGNNLDSNLVNLEFNVEMINKIIEENDIEKIYFSSKFVEKLFRKLFKNIMTEFPNIVLVTLPSPSPRYAAMRMDEKIKIYKELLPKLTKQ